MKAVRVLHFIPTAEGGGTESSLLRLLRHQPKGTFTYGVFIHSGYIKRVPFRRASSTDLNTCLQEGLAFTREFKPDVIHGWLGPSCAVAAFAGSCDGLPFVLRQPTNLKRELEDNPWLANNLPLMRASFRAADRIIVPSAALVDSTQELCGPCRFEVIPNGFQARSRRLRNSRSHFQLTVIGRLVPSKGHIHLLEAIRLLRKTHSNFRLAIVGDGELRGPLEDYVERHDLRGCVSFWSFQNDVHRFLQKTDLFVLPTLCEGMSNALLEAAAYGLPIVTTRIAENEFFLDHGKSAWMVPPGDATALRKSIETLMNSRALCRRLGTGARKRASGFTVNAMVKRHHNLYREVA